MSKELTKADLLDPLARWLDLPEGSDLADDPDAATVIGAINKWLADGKSVAVYENHDLGHFQLGHRRYLSCGTPEAQFDGEPPSRLPDFPGEINWRYILLGVYQGPAL